MKIELHHVLLVLCLAILSPAGVYFAKAQDASYPIPDAYEEAEVDKVIYSPGEGDPMMNIKAEVNRTKDSVSTKPAGVQSANSAAEEPKNSPDPSTQEDESALSFNFLYYLFEKYKMQDIVD